MRFLWKDTPKANTRRNLAKHGWEWKPMDGKLVLQRVPVLPAPTPHTEETVPVPWQS